MYKNSDGEQFHQYQQNRPLAYKTIEHGKTAIYTGGNPKGQA